MQYGRFRKTPTSIKDHKYNWLFASEWQMIHNRMDGNSFTFFIGSNGSGKTFANLRRCEILGVDEHDSYGRLFDPDHLENHVFFDRQDMQNKIAQLEKLPTFKTRGYQLMLDEAQMTANAKQWNDRQILEFSKEMTTIRSSRFNISMTMPTFRMITTDLRQLGTYMCEMMPASFIDSTRGLAFGKLHLLTLKPYLGEVWRNRPYIRFEEVNPVTGIPLGHAGLLSEFSWELPSPVVRRNYEKMKKEFRKLSSERKASVDLDKEKKVSNSRLPIDELAKKFVKKFSGDYEKVTGAVLQSSLNVGFQKALAVKSHLEVNKMI